MPGASPCSASVSAHDVGVGVSLTAVMTSATLRVPAAGELGRDAVDQRAGVGRAHVIAQVGQRRRRGGVLGLAPSGDSPG